MSKTHDAVIEIRPTRSALAMQPFGLQVVLVVVVILAAWSAASSSAARWTIALATLVAACALVVWQLAYHWRARIAIHPSDFRVEIRGRLISQVIHIKDIRSATPYGPPGNLAIAYLDGQNHRILTLRLAYWSIEDIRQLNDQLGVVLGEGVASSGKSPPGRGLLPFLERHGVLVGGCGIPLLVAVALAIALAVWIKWPT